MSKKVTRILTICSKNWVDAVLYTLRIAVKYPLIAADIAIAGSAKHIRYKIFAETLPCKKCSTIKLLQENKIKLAKSPVNKLI